MVFIVLVVIAICAYGSYAFYELVINVTSESLETFMASKTGNFLIYKDVIFKHSTSNGIHWLSSDRKQFRCYSNSSLEAVCKEAMKDMKDYYEVQSDL